MKHDYYIVSVTIGGRILVSSPMTLYDAEQMVKDILNAAPNVFPQIIFHSEM